MIVDDEPLAIDVLKRYIQVLPGLELIGAYEKPMEAFDVLQQQKVDLLFLDIQMPGLTGLELLRSLQDLPKVILTTAFREFAVEGFDLEVLDYLVKPVSQERFLKAISKFYRTVKRDEPIERDDEPFIFMKVDREMIKLKFDDIQLIEGLKNYVKVRTGHKDLIVYHTLGYLEDKLPVRVFKRIHKSFIINLDKIDKFSSGSVVIQGKFIPVGKMYQKDLDEVLKKRMI
jgi:DNA-binding LytR/AlgR family response regulator